MNKEHFLHGIHRIGLVAFVAVLFGALTIEAAPWAPATANPPLNDAEQLLDAGPLTQTKTGILTVGGLRVVGGKMLIPFGATTPVDSDFTANTSLWAGSSVRASDFCLNSNPTTCLNSVPVPTVSGGHVFSGKATLPSNSSPVCHPLQSGTCGTTSEKTLGLRVPFAMTLTSLEARISTQVPVTENYNCILRVRVAPAGCTGVFSDTALTVNCATGYRDCYPTTGSVAVPAGACIQLRFYPHDRFNPDLLADDGTTRCGGRTIKWSLLAQ